MGPGMKNRRSVTFVLPGDRWDEVLALSQREGRTPSGQLRYIIDRYLDGAAGTDLRRLADERVARLMRGDDPAS